MRGQIKDMGLTLGGDLTVTLSLPREHTEGLRKLMDGPVSVEIKAYKERRSLDANALCWCICGELGRAMGLSDVEVYRMAIRDAGEYEHLPIKAVAVDTFARRWQSKGLGWFVDVLDDSKLPGYKVVKAYYGSSSYTTQEMSRMLDWLVDNAKQAGITLKASAREIEAAKERWGEDA